MALGRCDRARRTLSILQLCREPDARFGVNMRASTNRASGSLAFTPHTPPKARESESYGGNETNENPRHHRVRPSRWGPRSGPRPGGATMDEKRDGARLARLDDGEGEGRIA